MANTIEQYGITWTFDKNLSADGAGDTYRYGQFVNGDYWVVGPVNIIEISPPCHAAEEGETDINDRVFATGTIIHGSMINPEPGVTQGYFSSTYGPDGWNAALNVALGVSAEDPLNLPINSSLVSSISRVDPGSGNRSKMHTCAVLTVMEEAPAEGSFRPPYCGSVKTALHNVSELDEEAKGFSLLGTLQPVVSTPSITTYEGYFEKVWLDHKGYWSGRAAHPASNMPDYGRDISNRIMAAALLLNLDLTGGNPSLDNAEIKRTLLIRFLQLGIDLYGIATNGGTTVWVNDGAHGPGRKLPILFAGRLFDDAAMLGIADKSGDYLYTGEYGPGDAPPDYIHFGEDDQTHYVAQLDVDLTNGPTWNPDSRDAIKTPYSVEDIGMPEYGIYHATSPRNNNKDWGTAYRITSGNTFPNIVMAAYVCGVAEIWNHPALFDYADRHVGIQGIGAGFVKNMWDAYRANYGPLWTADLSVTAEATGIRDTEIDLKATISGGVGTPSVQWQQWNGEAFVDIVGATTAIYTVTGLFAGTEYTFKVVVEDEESPATQVTDTVVVSTTGEESPSQYLLQVGSGITISGATPVEGNYYEADAVLTLTAVEGRYSIFAGWSGGASGKRKQTKITMDAARTVQANFVPADVNRVNISGLSLITKTPIEV